MKKLAFSLVAIFIIAKVIKLNTSPSVKVSPQDSITNHQISIHHNTLSIVSNDNNQVKILNNEFQRLDELKGHLNKHELRKQRLDELAANAQNIELAQRTLLDLDWAIEQFGDNQAQARVYSIELLKTKAKLGDSAPLEDSGKQLSALLTNDASQWIKGREHDLRDIMGAYIEVKGHEAIVHNPKLLFDTFNYNPLLKKIFQRTMFSYLYNSGTDEEVSKAFMPFWS